MYDYSKLVSKKVWQELLRVLPTPRQKRFGRRRCAKEALLNWILQVLINGVAWRKIADCGCSYASCFRYFQELQRRGKLKLIYRLLAKEKTNIVEGITDTTTVDSFEFRHMTEWDGFMKYMSILLRRTLRSKGIRVNMKWRDQDFRRKKGPKFKFDEDKYAKRFLLERTNGWLKSFRAIRIRRTYHIAMFKALVYLALIIVLIRS